MATALLYDPRMNLHDDPTHPENAGRLALLAPALASLDPAVFMQRAVQPATEQQIRTVHQRSMIAQTQMLAYEGGWLGLDTYVTSDSWEAALLATGAAIGATAAVLDGEVANAFAVVRPPGHHATPVEAMGFCLVNNVAVAAQYALDRGDAQRIAIIDWDVHHGNGTQDIFYTSEQVLYCSTHNYPFYPGTGHWREMGKGTGWGTTLNVPLAIGADDRAFAQAYTELILPAVRRFAPDLIFVSAGYDAHWSDPLGAMYVSTTTYTAVAQAVYNLAAAVCNGRLICVLEGGYHPAALAECVVSTLGVLGAQPELVQDQLGPHPGSAVMIDPLVRELRQHHPLLI